MLLDSLWVRMQNILSKLGLTIFSIIIGLVIGEIVVRSLGFGHVAERSLMFSSPTWKLDSGNAVRYLPNQKIRTVAAYEGNIEYDIQFQTNNLGFVDNVDYVREAASNKKYYAFVGDSFTAGYHGGESWVPQLRDRVRGQNVGIYNLGIGGTGVEQFSRLLKSVSQQIKFSTIVVLAISNDFQRKSWYPVVQDNDISFCRESTGIPQCGRVAKVIQRDVTADGILEILLKQVAEDRKNDNILKQSQLLAFIKRSTANLLGRSVYTNMNIKRSLHSLKEIRDTFPNTDIHLVHLPQKEEVAIGAYQLEFSHQVEEMGIKYYPALTRCNWSNDMFFANDSHPNRSGYENISFCVSEYLLFNR